MSFDSVAFNMYFEKQALQIPIKNHDLALNGGDSVKRHSDLLPSNFRAIFAGN